MFIQHQHVPPWYLLSSAVKIQIYNFDFLWLSVSSTTCWWRRGSWKTPTLSTHLTTDTTSDSLAWSKVGRKYILLYICQRYQLKSQILLTDTFFFLNSFVYWNYQHLFSTQKYTFKLNEMYLLPHSLLCILRSSKQKSAP